MNTSAWREGAQPRGKGGRFGHKPPATESDPNDLYDPDEDDFDEDTCQYCGYPIDDCEDSPCEDRLDARAEDDDDGRYDRDDKSWDNRIEATFDGGGSVDELDDPSGARWTRSPEGTWSTPDGPQGLTGEQMRELDRSQRGPFSLPPG